jgi:pimeloyl-ACP methyl ester carboxylesterase
VFHLGILQVIALFAATLWSPTTVGQTDGPARPLIPDAAGAVQVDAQYPAVTRPVAIPSGTARMNGVLFLAQGLGPHPNAVILHGFPGSTKNEDLAYAIRRAGWNVLTFQYRGSWGSEGDFSYSGALDDVSAAIAFLEGPNGPGGRGLSDQVVLIGHSFGGWAALMTAASHSKVRAVASIAGRNVGSAARNLRNPERYAEALRTLEANMLPIRGTSAADLLRERLRHAEEWDLIRHASSLSPKTILLIGGQRDTAAPLVEDHIPLVEELKQKGAPKMTSIVLNADHAFSDERIALAETVIAWLVELELR